MMLKIADLYSLIAEDIERSARLFREALASDLPLINDLCRHVDQFHGKRLRPALLLLVAKACGGIRPAHHTLAAVVEMVHIATLVHDDVLDEADLRRRCTTINRLHGNEAAVLLGDYLISHAFHLCSSLDSQYASRLIGSTTNTVCEGELMQVFHRGDYDLSEETYFEIISRKTASLVATCCILGSRFAGADPAVIAAAERYGMSVGVAFQIIDDVLDLQGTEQETGKTLGRDLDKEKLTLPIIHYLRTADRDVKAEALAVMNNGHQDRAERIARMVSQSDSVRYAYHKARHHVRVAVEALAVFPDGDAKDSLTAMAEFIIDRHE
jgi:octaprenyl-diphosphate synthase